MRHAPSILAIVLAVGCASARPPTTLAAGRTEDLLAPLMVVGFIGIVIVGWVRDDNGPAAAAPSSETSSSASATPPTRKPAVETECSFGGCALATAMSSCSFGDCKRHGWTATAIGRTTDSSCSFGDCNTYGWSTTSPEGRSESRCNLGDCTAHGWTTTLPTGQTLSCSCRLFDCATHGASCH